MKQKYVIGIAVILAFSLVTQIPFGYMKNDEPKNPLELILGTLQSIDTKLDTIIELLTPEPSSGPGFNAPQILDVDYQPSDPVVGDTVVLGISVEDVDNTLYGYHQALDISTKFINTPALSTATLIPSFGSNPAFVPDLVGTYELRITVTDDTGRSDWYDIGFWVGP